MNPSTHKGARDAILSYASKAERSRNNFHSTDDNHSGNRRHILCGGCFCIVLSPVIKQKKGFCVWPLSMGHALC